jgi:DNA-binding LacI/PurR family transcriptional regulator
LTAEVPIANVCNVALDGKAVSIKDIARRARVSHSTVSRALRGSPLVNPKTAQRIQKIATAANFRVSAVARSLVSRRTFTIGVVVTTIADPFNAQVVSGIEDVANQRGYSVFLANSKSDPDREVRVVNSFDERRVDGIIVTSSRVGTLYNSLLAHLHIPVVFLNNHNPAEYANAVSIDNFQASKAAVEHLIALGHRRIGYLGDAFGLQSDGDRQAGYRAAMEGAGLKIGRRSVEMGNGHAEGALRAMVRMLDSGNQPTALFCYNDMTALGALRVIHEHGLRVPEDISLVGFDDLPVTEYTNPPLTTIRQPMEQMGRRAMEILNELLNGKKPERETKFPGELIVRQSTAPPPATRVSKR